MSPRGVGTTLKLSHQVSTANRLQLIYYYLGCTSKQLIEIFCRWPYYICHPHPHQPPTLYINKPTIDVCTTTRWSQSFQILQTSKWAQKNPLASHLERVTRLPLPILQTSESAKEICLAIWVFARCIESLTNVWMRRKKKH